MTQPAPDCLSQDNTRADGMSGKVIYDLLHNGPGTGSLNAGSTTAGTLNTDYADIENRLRTVGAKLGEGWTGASSDAAAQAASPINKAVIDMQTALQDADRSIDSQGVQFAKNKAALKPVAAERPESGFWNDVTPWETDTDRAISGYNADEAENRRLYTQYQGASATNRDQLPSNISGVTADTLDVTIAESSGSETPNQNNSSSSRFTNPQSSAERQNIGQVGQPTTSYVPPPSINGDGTTNTSGNTGNPTLPTPTPQGLGGNTVGNQHGNGGLPGGGIVGPGGIGTGTGLGRPGAGRTGTGTPGGGSRGGGASGGGAGGSTGRGGPGGGGPGGGFGSTSGRPGESALGPGGKSGVLGGIGANDAAGGRGGFGPTGSGAAGGRGGGGAAGMGGMGGGGAKGNGDEDGEHSSADYLVTEENGNTIVGDMPLTSPPVIGG